MAEVMVREIEVGIDGSGGVRCGVIGEIGCSYPLMDVEKRALQAAASAQTKTGEVIIMQIWSQEKQTILQLRIKNSPLKNLRHSCT